MATTLMEIRELILAVCSRYEMYIERAFRALATLLALVILNGRIGYMEELTGILPTLLITLISMLIPTGGTLFLLAVLIILHLYALALEAAAVGAVLILLLILVYFRFSPEDGILLLLYPVCGAVGVPYALPIAGGLLYSPVSGIMVAAGVVVDRFLLFVSENETAIRSSEINTDEIISRFQFLIDGIIGDEVMLIRAAAVIAAAALVYLVRRLSIPYSWMIASGVGAVSQMVILLVGAVVMDAQIGVAAAFLGVAASFGIGAVISFFAFNLDYSRTEVTQFEDDDYYYYVKAVPKSGYARPRRTVKNISTHRSPAAGGGGRRTGYRDDPEERDEWDPELSGYSDDEYAEDDMDPDAYRDGGYGPEEYDISGDDY